MTYLILGAGGQLGTACSKRFPEAVALTRGELDITDEVQVNTAIAEHRPTIIINAGAPNDVEGAESDYQTAFAGNAFGPMLLARAANASGAALVHISTDYVFDGSKEAGFTETDRPNPINVYGTSKYAGEQLVRAYTNDFYILRTSALFGERREDSGNNFVTKRLKQMEAGSPITMVNDQWTIPTYAPDLADVIAQLLEQQAPFGTYHAVSGGGGVTWYEFTKAIAAAAGKEGDITPIESVASGSVVPRPRYSILADTKLAALGITIPTWQDALERYITSIT